MAARRIEGQRFVMAFCKEIQKILGIEGIESVIPAADGRFCSVTKPDPKRVGNWQDASYTSNWSERHVALCLWTWNFWSFQGDHYRERDGREIGEPDCNGNI